MNLRAAVTPSMLDLKVKGQGQLCPLLFDF